MGTPANSQQLKANSQSLSKWNELKKTHGNSYIYQTTFTSFTGVGGTTEIKVENGTVRARIYQEFKINQNNGAKQVVFAYTETGEDLGLNRKGAPALTIDELYQSCANNYITVDPEKNAIIFQTSEEGLMTVCGFYPDGCMDDCFNGLRIDSFRWGK